MATFRITATCDSNLIKNGRLQASLRAAGSHFLTHATWQWLEDECIGYLCIDAETEEEVRLLIPPILRGCVTIRPTEVEAAACGPAGQRIQLLPAWNQKRPAGAQLHPEPRRRSPAGGVAPTPSQET